MPPPPRPENYGLDPRTLMSADQPAEPDDALFNEVLESEKDLLTAGAKARPKLAKAKEEAKRRGLTKEVENIKWKEAEFPKGTTPQIGRLAREAGKTYQFREMQDEALKTPPEDTAWERFKNKNFMEKAGYVLDLPGRVTRAAITSGLEAEKTNPKFFQQHPAKFDISKVLREEQGDVNDLIKSMESSPLAAAKAFSATGEVAQYPLAPISGGISAASRGVVDVFDPKQDVTLDRLASAGKEGLQSGKQFFYGGVTDPTNYVTLGTAGGIKNVSAQASKIASKSGLKGEAAQKLVSAVEEAAKKTMGQVTGGEDAVRAALAAGATPEAIKSVLGEAGEVLGKSGMGVLGRNPLTGKPATLSPKTEAVGRSISQGIDKVMGKFGAANNLDLPENQLTPIKQRMSQTRRDMFDEDAIAARQKQLMEVGVEKPVPRVRREGPRPEDIRQAQNEFGKLFGQEPIPAPAKQANPLVDDLAAPPKPKTYFEKVADPDEALRMARTQVSQEAKNSFDEWLKNTNTKALTPDQKVAVQQLFDAAHNPMVFPKVQGVMKEFNDFLRETTMFGRPLAYNVKNIYLDSSAMLGSGFNPLNMRKAPKALKGVPDAVANSPVYGKIAGKELLERAKQLGLWEKEQLGGMAGDTLKSGKGIGQIAGEVATFGFSKWGKKRASEWDRFSKMSMFIDRLEKGDTFEQAAKNVGTVLFDYSDPGNYPKVMQLLKTGLPLSGWAQRAVKNVPKHYLRNPALFKSELYKSETPGEYQDEPPGYLTAPTRNLGPENASTYRRGLEMLGVPARPGVGFQVPVPSLMEGLNVFNPGEWDVISEGYSLPQTALKTALSGEMPWGQQREQPGALDVFPAGSPMPEFLQAPVPPQGVNQGSWSEFWKQAFPQTVTLPSNYAAELMGQEPVFGPVSSPEDRGAKLGGSALNWFTGLRPVPTTPMNEVYREVDKSKRVRAKAKAKREEVKKKYAPKK